MRQPSSWVKVSWPWVKKRRAVEGGPGVSRRSELSFSAYVHRQIIAPALDDSQHAWHHSDDDLTAFVLNGSPRTPRMPAWKGTLSEGQVRDIVAYIKSLCDARNRVSATEAHVLLADQEPWRRMPPL